MNGNPAGKNAREPGILGWFLVIYLLMLAVLTAVFTLFYNHQVEAGLAALKLEETRSLTRQEQLITQSFDPVIRDVLFLARINELDRLLRHDTPAARDELAREFAVFAEHRGCYDQVRYLDGRGQETVRVNLVKGRAVIVPAGELQDKSSRYYFQEAIKLGDGEVFISRFDLNIEHGKVETPYKPVIRFATPVFDSRGERRGVVVLNYLGEDLLRRIREENFHGRGRTMLLDCQGYWLLAKNHEDEWGFMFQERAARTFPNRHPEAWEIINTQHSGQVRTKEGLFTFTTVFPVSPASPLAARIASSSGCRHSPPPAPPSSLSSPYWKLVSLVPEETISSISRDQAVDLFCIGSFLAVLGMLPAWFTARTLVERRQHLEQLGRMAHYDPLTGLANRFLFLDRLGQALAEAKRYQLPLALLSLDIDNFKEINDRYGHAAGDKVIKTVGRFLNGQIRRSDTAGRMGGDEFTVLLRGGGLREAETVADKILSGIAGLDLPAVPSVSIGISSFPECGTSVDELLRAADTAMYQAKKQGGGRWSAASRQPVAEKG